MRLEPGEERVGMTRDGEEYDWIVHSDMYQYLSRAALIPTLATFVYAITRRLRHSVGTVSPQWHELLFHPCARPRRSICRFNVLTTICCPS